MRYIGMSPMVARLWRRFAGLRSMELRRRKGNFIAAYWITFPRMSPLRGPSGTVFTITWGTLGGTAPITTRRRLVQGGVDVSDQIVFDQASQTFKFTSSGAGSLVLTETPRNPAGLGEAKTSRSVVGEVTAVTNPDGSSTEEFPDGTVVVTQPDGSAETTYPDGTTTGTSPDGEVTYEEPDGDTIVVEPDGTVIETKPDGTSTATEPDGSSKTEKPDGTVIVRDPDGTETTTEPDGTVIVKEPGGNETTTEPDGTVIVKQPDGTEIVTSPDGTVTTTRPDGTVIVENPDGTSSETAPDGTVTVRPPRPQAATAPGISPEDGPVGTSFTFTPGTYTGEGPITVTRWLFQGDVDVTDQMLENSFVSTAPGLLRYLETPANAGGTGRSQEVWGSTGQVAPYIWRPPVVTPLREPVGTVFTFQAGRYAGTRPITVERSLTQAGVNVTAQLEEDTSTNPPTFTFISSAMGDLVYTEVPTNSVGSGEASSVQALVTDIPTLRTPGHIEPAEGFVGTVFVLTYAQWDGTTPISVARTLTQNGVDVTNQIVNRRFTATELGPLVLSEVPTNEVDEGFGTTVGAQVVVPTPVSNVAPPSITPGSGPAGTVFTLRSGSYEGSNPIGMTWTLTQAGVDVTDQIVGDKFTSTVTGGELILTETPSNPAGIGTPQTAVAQLVAYSTFRSLYRMAEGTGAVIRASETPGFGSLGSDGTISGAGATWAAGPVLAFAHQNAGIVRLAQVPHQTDGDLLMGVLVKRNPTTSAAQQGIFGAGSGSTGIFRLMFDDGKQTLLYVQDDTSAQFYAYSYDKSDDVNWMMITLLLKNQEAILRINGVENNRLVLARPRRQFPYDTQYAGLTLAAIVNASGSVTSTLGGEIAAYDHVAGANAEGFTEGMEASLRAIAAERGLQIGKPILHRRTFPLTETSGSFAPVKENPDDGNVVMTIGSGVTRLGGAGPGISFDGSANAWAKISNGGIPSADWFGEDMVITTLIRPTAEKAANSIATATGLNAPIFLAKYAGKDLVVQTYDAYSTNFFTTTAVGALVLGEWALVTMVIKNRETIIRVNGVERARTAHGQRRRNTGTAVNAPMSSITTAVPYFVGSGATSASSPAATLPFTGDMALYDHYNGSDADNRIAILEANARAVAQERGIILPA